MRRVSAVFLVCLLLLAGCKNASRPSAPETSPPDVTVFLLPQTREDAGNFSTNVSQPSSVPTETVPYTEPTNISANETAASVPEEAPLFETQPPQTTEVSTAPVAADETLITNGGTELQLSQLRHYSSENSAPAVYFTREISPEALLRIYGALPYTLSVRIAVKLSTGESSASNFLKPDLIGGLVRSLNASIVECMTAYGGVRAVAALHKQVAVDRGYTSIAQFDLMDEDGDFEIPYAGTRIDRAIVGDHIRNYDGVLVLSHFKGHPMAGFGGAIKNVGIGMSSRTGKIYVHSAGTRTTGIVLHNDQKAWLEALAETVKAVSDYENGGRNMLYISVMNRLSVDCDCMALPAEPDMHDIGVLASADPVALDQACVDLIYAAPDGQALILRMESRYGEHVLEHAEAIGLGSRSYRLVSIDAP